MFFSFVSVAWGVHIFAASTCDVRFSTSEEVSSGPFVTPRALSHVFSALFHLDGVLSEMARCQAGLKGPGGFCKQFRASLIAATRLKNTARKRPQRQPAATSSRCCVGISFRFELHVHRLHVYVRVVMSSCGIRYEDSRPCAAVFSPLLYHVCHQWRCAHTSTTQPTDDVPTSPTIQMASPLVIGIPYFG